MADNEMLARRHRGTRKIVTSDNIFVTEKCNDGETFSTEQVLMFSRPASNVDAALCGKPCEGLGLLIEKQKPSLLQCLVM